MKTDCTRSWGSFVHVLGPAHYHVGEGLLPERSVGMKEAQRTKTMHAWQLRTMTDRGRLLTDNSYKSRIVFR